MSFFFRFHFQISYVRLWKNPFTGQREKSQEIFPDSVLSWELSLIIPVLDCYQGKFPDIVLSREFSLIMPVLKCYQGKFPDNKWLARSLPHERII